MAGPANLISYIYIVSIEDGPTKVGHTMDTARRMKQLQALFPWRELFLAGKWPVGASIAHATERYVHWLLRKSHISGEWFDASREEVVAAIEKGLRGEVNHYDMIPPIGHIAQGLNTGEFISTKFPRGTRERPSCGCRAYTRPVHPGGSRSRAEKARGSQELATR